ncbi:ABC-2 type transporter family protein [Rhodococcus sp. MTM3W5.2]|uniref:ABC transporter permease n=1 Tax=Rhodococcus sp. MTM3W5.2 TaxID=1805827 RepID=UPI0009796087|nr:ABC transporter permease [Rhodococcus sp. MTM3W5.2]AQA25498.1 ABC-2 type transporter family protein [Rhodococcus sp. MTM3W5.2]
MTAVAASPVVIARTGRHRKPQLSSMQQWLALSGRNVHIMWSHGQFFVAVLAPLIFTLGFYLPLKFVMKVQGIDYAQFVMPIIVLQAMAFTAISAAGRAATEASNGMNARFQTMPIFSAVPLASRVTAMFIHALISLIAAVTYGHVIGFEFVGGTSLAVGFCALALAVGMTLAMAGDALGTLTKSPEITSQSLTLPQLILGMFSSGFVPESQFPEWSQGFVRNQPISQFSVSMRSMAEGHITLHQLTPSLLWIGGLLLVSVPLSIWANVRRG